MKILPKDENNVVCTQGTFGVREEMSAVFEFITENLETPLPFHILDSVTGARLDNAAASLQVTIGPVP